MHSRESGVSFHGVSRGFYLSTALWVEAGTGGDRYLHHPRTGLLLLYMLIQDISHHPGHFVVKWTRRNAIITGSREGL